MHIFTSFQIQIRQKKKPFIINIIFLFFLLILSLYAATTNINLLYFSAINLIQIILLLSAPLKYSQLLYTIQFLSGAISFIALAITLPPSKYDFYLISSIYLAVTAICINAILGLYAIKHQLALVGSIAEAKLSLIIKTIGIACVIVNITFFYCSFINLRLLDSTTSFLDNSKISTPLIEKINTYILFDCQSFSRNSLGETKAFTYPVILEKFSLTSEKVIINYKGWSKSLGNFEDTIEVDGCVTNLDSGFFSCKKIRPSDVVIFNEEYFFDGINNFKMNTSTQHKNKYGDFETAQMVKCNAKKM